MKEFFILLIFILHLSPIFSNPKKWGYILSNDLPKWKPKYIEKISNEFDVITINGLEFNGRGQLRYVLPFLDKISQAELTSKEKISKIYPMIVFSSVRDGIELLNSNKFQEKASENLILFLKENKFKAVHLDFEYLPIEYDKKLSIFINLIFTKLKKEKIKLTISFFPQEDFNPRIAKFHNAELLANSVDEIVLMSYDYHNPKTEAGCITSYEWTKKNLNYLLKYFKTDQIWLGVPAYGYEWFIEKKKVKVVSSYDGTEYNKIYKGTREESGCIKIIKKEKSLIYFADKNTRLELEKISKEYNLIGTSIWRLGLEENDLKNE